MYKSLAPFEEERMDLRLAQVCQMIVNMQRDTKEHPEPIPLEKFLLKFGDAQPTTRRKKPEERQSIEEQERNLRDWVMGANQAYAEEHRHG